MPDDIIAFTDDSSSEYKLVYEQHPRYFFACVEANDPSPEAIKEFQTKMAIEIARRKYDRVMIKRDVPITVAAVELCGVIYKVPHWKVRKIKYAFVDVNPAHLSAYKFSILFAGAHGIEVEAFADIPSAEEWLLQ